MSQQEWQCPFCATTSSRPQGLSAHVRNRHAKQYQKWSKTPTRISDALRSTAAPVSSRSQSLPSSGHDGTAPAVVNAGDASTLELLNQVYGKLLARKQAIESELARFDEMKKEIETIDLQIEAVAKTLSVFEPPAEAAETEQTQYAALSAKGD